MEGFTQVACDNCTQGVMATNPHLRGECDCECHARCSCGAELVSCHGCSHERCLTCDPYSEAERLGRCCIQGDTAIIRADGERSREALVEALGFVKAAIDFLGYAPFERRVEHLGFVEQYGNAAALLMSAQSTLEAALTDD